MATNQVCILGAGAFGTAAKRHLLSRGAQVRTWRRGEDLSVLRGADFAVFAVPAQAFRPVLSEAIPYLGEDTVIVNLAKGIEQGTLLRLSEVAAQIAPGVRYVALSGPSHAEEILSAMPTDVCVSSADRAAMEAAQELFFSETFRVYTNDDLCGVELGGAVKNVIAVAVGIADGLGYGDNTKAALITRGLAEISRLGEALGARRETFLGLSGVGDLVVTCGSDHSRNLRCGRLLGCGVPLADALAEVGQTVEGVPTCDAIYSLSEKYGVDMPITRFLYGFLHGKITLEQGRKMLLSRPKKGE